VAAGLVQVLYLDGNRLRRHFWHRLTPECCAVSQRSFDRLKELLAIERFGDKRLDTETVHLLSVNVSISTDDHRARRNHVNFSQPAEQSHPIHNGHVYIGEQKVGRSFLEYVKRCSPVAGCPHSTDALPEKPGRYGCAELRLVVHH
jgi:hypothetical protein